jgi:hypothetical protein
MRRTRGGRPRRGRDAGLVVDDDRDAHYCWMVGVDEGGTIPFMRM